MRLGDLRVSRASLISSHNSRYSIYMITITDPVSSRLVPVARAALVATNVLMWIMAMSMSFLTQVSWYPVYNHIPGVTLPPFADQQIGAGILWVCGDFWAIPALIVVVRRIINSDGSVSSAVDRILGRATSTTGGGTGWASRAGR